MAWYPLMTCHFYCACICSAYVVPRLPVFGEVPRQARISFSDQQVPRGHGPPAAGRCGLGLSSESFRRQRERTRMRLERPSMTSAWDATCFHGMRNLQVTALLESGDIQGRTPIRSSKKLLHGLRSQRIFTYSRSIAVKLG